ncbi:MAG: c-type cytochrome [Sphingopyxis sp.]
MDDRNNIVMGWALGAGIVALGLTYMTGQYFHGAAPETPGYAIAGGASEGAGAAAEVPIEALLAAADVAKGEAVFAKCARCHTVNAGGAAGIGPNLNGIVGRGIAAGSFAYSDGLRSHGGTWDWTNLNAWLTSPRRFADGTKMSFAGLSSAEDRANLMAYLNAQGSNLPMPAAPAAPAPVAEATPAEGEAAAPAAPAAAH